MRIGLTTIEMRIYNSQSLKDKRQILKSIIERIKNKYNVSICESDFQDKWQYAAISFVQVSTNSKVVDSTHNSIVEFIEKYGEVEIIKIYHELI